MDALSVYLVIFISIIFGLCIAAMNFWSYYLVRYNSFWNGILATLLFTLGKADVSGMLDTYTIPGVIYIFVFALFVIYGMLAVLMGLYLQTYRKTLTEIGYPDDVLQPHPWTAKDFLLWICGFLPDTVLNKCKNLIEGDQTPKHHDDEDEDESAHDNEPAEFFTTSTQKPLNKV